ncbi:SanA/YdcF family protein [Halotalea alkalilenta]|nr:ElyC/SanA/YdcF family protein [Halotalea alkalilenta]
MAAGMKRRWRRAAGWLTALVLGLILLTLVLFGAANLWVWAATRDRLVADATLCPRLEVGIVFGTSSRMRSGVPNPYYHARLDTAAELWRLGRIEHLLLSGDNRSLYYNEPVTMWRDLLARHVPRSAMTLDYAGLSTFDTLVRAREVFGVEQAALVTQPWHLPRALFIAQAEGIDAYGCAAMPEQAGVDRYVSLREWFARAMTVGDLYLWHREPRFLGPKEPLLLD